MRCDFCGLNVCDKCHKFNPLGKKLAKHIQEGLHKYLPGCFFGPDEVYELLMDKYKVLEALEYAEDIIANYQMDINADNEDWLGVNLVEAGFCQGTIYQNALYNIRELKGGDQDSLE